MGALNQAESGVSKSSTLEISVDKALPADPTSCRAKSSCCDEVWPQCLQVVLPSNTFEESTERFKKASCAPATYQFAAKNSCCFATASSNFSVRNALACLYFIEYKADFLEGGGGGKNQYP